MALYFTSLNSGSNGNCYYVGNEQEAVLVDAGLSCREIEKRMQRLQLPLHKVKALFISHEHSDHIRGVPVLAAKYNLPVYITEATHRSCPWQLPLEQVYSFSCGQTIAIGDLEIICFGKVHDAIEPHSFVINYKGTKVGVFTDLGVACKNLIEHFSQCHAAFLEANYDEEMLDKGNYPYYLKKRIRGGQGHLSNKQALECFTKYKSPNLRCLVLAHLSKENNCPQLVAALFRQFAMGTEIVVASREGETALYQVKAVTQELAAFRPKPLSGQQMSLFG